MATDAFGEPGANTIDVPRPFNGSEAQRRANFRSHEWNDRARRCWTCDVRMGSTSSFYACGAVVPRMEVVAGSPEATAALRRSLGN